MNGIKNRPAVVHPHLPVLFEIGDNIQIYLTIEKIYAAIYTYYYEKRNNNMFYKINTCNFTHCVVLY